MAKPSHTDRLARNDHTTRGAQRRARDSSETRTNHASYARVQEFSARLGQRARRQLGRLAAREHQDQIHTSRGHKRRCSHLTQSPSIDIDDDDSGDSDDTNNFNRRTID